MCLQIFKRNIELSLQIFKRNEARTDIGFILRFCKLGNKTYNENKLTISELVSMLYIRPFKINNLSGLVYFPSVERFTFDNPYIG